MCVWNLHREMSGLFGLFVYLFNIDMNSVYCYNSNTVASYIYFDTAKQFSNTKTKKKTWCGYMGRRHSDVIHVSLVFLHRFSSRWCVYFIRTRLRAMEMKAHHSSKRGLDLMHSLRLNFIWLRASRIGSQTLFPKKTTVWVFHADFLQSHFCATE